MNDAKIASKTKAQLANFMGWAKLNRALPPCAKLRRSNWADSCQETRRVSAPDTTSPSVKSNGGWKRERRRL